MKLRLDASLPASLALHVVLGAALAYILSLPVPLRRLLDRDAQAPVPTERITFVAVPERNVEAGARATTRGRGGGDGRQVRRAKAPPPVVAPTEVPPQLPPVRPAPQAREEGGSGRVIGSGGPTQGIVPSFSDPRVWAEPGPLVSAPKTQAERLDSALASRVAEHNDSLAALAPSGRKPGDWTFERGGKKYGIDQQSIYLGGIKIPTAILALLPLKGIQGNPTAMERERVLAAMRSDIQYQAQRAMNEDEFRAAVKRIRERKDRERQRALTASKGERLTP